MKKQWYLVVCSIFIIGLFAGYTYKETNNNHKNPYESKPTPMQQVKETINTEDTQVEKVLQWRFEVKPKIEDETVPITYLYLQAIQNPNIEVYVGCLDGGVESFEQYKDRYPADSILPISSWIGGGGGRNRRKIRKPRANKSFC